MNETYHLLSYYDKLSHLRADRENLGILSIIYILTATIFFYLLASSMVQNRTTIKAPYIGYRKWFEPTFLVRLRFVFNAHTIISQGYKKYKNGIFVVRRNDTDLVVLSNHYLDELRLLPNTKLSSVQAQIKNLLGKYTYTLVMLESNLHVRVLQNQLTPNLGMYLDRANAELEFSLENDVPRPEDWVEVDIQSIVRTMVSRMSAAVFLGYPVCRNKDWLKLSVDFSINVFTTSFTMRIFPPILHPLLALLLPSRYRIRQNLQMAESIILPMIEKHQQQREEKILGSAETKNDTLLTWMLENATDREIQPDKLAARQLILTLASIHTTSMAVSNALYDLCAHPEFFTPLLEEVIAALKGQMPHKEQLPRLEKLDSFLAESQRFNPPILLSPQRLCMETIKLRDGTLLPKGTRVAFASADILMDPAVTPIPETFDPFRSYKKRKEHGESNRHLMGQTDKDHLMFGHGKQSCPGRMFAVSEIKMILARFLLDWEFAYPEGKARPKNFFLDENIFPDPSAKLMIRRRRGEVS